MELSLGRDQKAAQKFFEKSAGKGYPDGYLGRVAILESRRATGEMRIVTKVVERRHHKLAYSLLTGALSIECPTHACPYCFDSSFNR